MLPSPNMPESVVQHLQAADTAAQHVLEAVTASRPKDLQALRTQLNDAMSAKTPARNRLIRIRHIAGQQSAIFSPKSACASGCSHCCHIDVTVPRSEALLIGKMTGKRVSEPSVTFPIDQPPAKSFVGSPCPFLADGRCSIYAHRPLLCRTLVNLDTSPKLCELVPNATIPVPYLNTTALRAAFTIVTQSDDFADIREWFAP